MKISVAICTWNRHQLLDQTLGSLAKMKIPSGIQWELIVVDNRSTEPEVPAILEKWQDHLPLKSVVENVQGHSASRNRAVAEATGDYIVWTDNDVLVSTDWLTSYCHAFQDHPDAVYFGGPIHPVIDDCPDWIRQTWEICAPVFAERKLADTEIPLGHNKLPYGANFAIRMDSQKRFEYDTKWGRKKDGMLGEDEVSVLRKIIDEGGAGFWVPSAQLEHQIPPDRATIAYVARYYHGQGFANALKDKIDRSTRQIWWDAITLSLNWRYHWLLSEPQVWVSKMVHSSICWGELAGLKARRREESL